MLCVKRRPEVLSTPSRAFRYNSRPLLAYAFTQTVLHFSLISRQVSWLLHDQQGAGMYTGIALPLSPTVKLYTAYKYIVLV